jgi:diacylglycerol kinase family enzyme
LPFASTASYGAGERRRLDLGWLDGERRPFVNSCVGGLTAASSAKTTPASKKRLGVLAYVLRTLAETRSFEGLKLDVRAGEAGDRVWTGEAILLLVGNGRRFPGERMRQANMEDGRCNVVIIERRPAMDYLTRGAADRLLRRGGVTSPGCRCRGWTCATTATPPCSHSTARSWSGTR